MFLSKHLAWSKVCECVFLPAHIRWRLISLPIPSLTSKRKRLIFIEHNPFYGWHCGARVEALHEILWDGVLPDKNMSEPSSSLSLFSYTKWTIILELETTGLIQFAQDSRCNSVIFSELWLKSWWLKSVIQTVKGYFEGNHTSDHLPFSSPCQSPPSMSALISSHSSQHRKSPDCSRMFLCTSATAAVLRNIQQKIQDFHIVTVLGRERSTHATMLFFLGPTSLFAKSKSSPFLHLRGSKTATLCENCSCSSQWSLHLCAEQDLESC